MERSGDALDVDSHTRLEDRRQIADGIEIIGSTPDELTAYMKAETVKWAEVIKHAGSKVD